MRIFALFLVLLGLSYSSTTQAQFSASRGAQHLAILRAVVNYKIDDEEHVRDIERLRENERFNQRVQRMLDRLQNTRTKDSRNRQVLEILENAGRDLERVLR